MFVQTFSQIVTGKKDVWLLYRSLFAKTWNDINAKVWPTGQRFFLQCQSQHGLKTLYTVMAALRGNKLFWSGAMNKLSTYCEQSSANLICFLIKMISSCQYATSFSLRNFTSSSVFETNYYTLTYDSQNLRKSQCYYCGI